MARAKLSDILRTDDDSTASPPFAAELAAAPPHPEEPTAAPPVPQEKSGAEGGTPRTYKFTANLLDHEYDQLEALTAAVVHDLAPRPVGKGWRARIVRTLIAIAARDPKLRARVVAELRKTA